MSTLFSVAAFAQTAVMPKLATAHKWQVSAIGGEKKDEKGRRFCSAKAGFSNGVILIVARDDQGGQSLAVEYQGKPFAAGATMPVVINAGGEQMQASALAATNRILLISLPRGGQIEAQMSANALIEVIASAQRHIFALGGFAVASTALDECLVKIGTGQDYEPVKIDAEAPKDSFKSSPAIHEKTVQRFSNVSEDEVRSFNPAEAARAALMQDEIQRLRKQNEELMNYRQEMESQMLSSQMGGGVQVEQPPIIQRSVKEVVWPAGKSFDDMVATYLTTEAARCPADFAQTPGVSYQVSNGPVSVVEIACLGTAPASGGAGRDYAGALLFASGQGVLQVVIYQGPAGLIEQALTERGKALAQLGIKTP